MPSKNLSNITTSISKIGFHYFPDTLHYSENDLQTFLPILQSMQVGWLVLEATLDRAIPENFLCGLIQAGIKPIIQFHLPLDPEINISPLDILVSSYGRWGVHHVVLYEKPNLRSSWPDGKWPQQELTERFMEIYKPTASLCMANDIVSILPPLEPGGSYWDTTFLHSVLSTLFHDKHDDRSEPIILSAYAHTHGHPFNWGMGGSICWPMAKPYYTPTSCEDHRGMHIADWYQEVAEKATGSTLPIILLQSGATRDPFSQSPLIENQKPNPRSMMDFLTSTVKGSSLPESVVAVCIWLLSAGPQDIQTSIAWWNSDGTPSEQIRAWLQDKSQHSVATPKSDNIDMRAGSSQTTSLSHYLLLPSFDWGVADWYLDAARPFIKKYQPTIGFSSKDAAKAGRITVLGGPELFSEDLLVQFRQNGSHVERIHADGISLATQLSER